METLITTAGSVLGFVVFIAIIGFIGLKFYTLASKESAFVRTGAGSQKVVLNGGAFVIPGIHEIIRVNMKTLRLDVDKSGKESLITDDRLRVDVKVDFYVRVKADEESVANAAQTLGKLTIDPVALKTQVEAKFVDALRAVTVTMKMYDLNSKRAEFVQTVQNVVAKDLAKNGLELESVSLTALNQTKKEFFDPTNAFDAEGLLVLTRETEARRKTVNDIEQDTAVQIETKNLETTTRQQDLRKQTEGIRLTTDQEIATMSANQAATIKQNQESARRVAEASTIEANRDLENSRIEASRATSEKKVIADASVKMQDQDQNIRVAAKSKDEAAAEASADVARALAVTAQEKVITARDVEIAERSKSVALVRAEEKAQEQAKAITVAAEAEKTASEAKASAIRNEATGARDASMLKADGTIAEGNAIAQALTAKNEALNKLSVDQVSSQIRLAIIAALPQIIEQSVKPLMNIDSIKIAEIGGISGSGNISSVNSDGTANGQPGGSLSDQVVSSALRYRTNAPMIDSLMKEVGLVGGGDMSKLLAGVVGVELGSSNEAATDTEVK